MERRNMKRRLFYKNQVESAKKFGKKTTAIPSRVQWSARHQRRIVLELRLIADAIP